MAIDKLAQARSVRRKYRRVAGKLEKALKGLTPSQAKKHSKEFGQDVIDRYFEVKAKAAKKAPVKKVVKAAPKKAVKKAPKVPATHKDADVINPDL